MRRTIKYIGWLIETKKPQDNNNNKNGKEQTQNEIQKTKWETQNRKTLPENRNRNPKTEISITNRQHTQKNTKLNRKTETESKNTNHSHKRRKQKQGNSLKYCLSCFIVFVLNRRLFRESMIAGYNYLRTSICKSISFPGPRSRWRALSFPKSPVPFSPRGPWLEDWKAKPPRVRFSIALVPFLVQSRQPNVRHNY